MGKTTTFTSESSKAFFETFSKENEVQVRYDKIKEPIALGPKSLVLTHPSFEQEEEWHGKCHKELSYLLPENRYLFSAQRKYKQGTPHQLAASIIADSIAEHRDYGEYLGRSRHLTHNRMRIINEVHKGLEGVDLSQLAPESEMLRSLINYDIQDRKNWMHIGQMSHAKELPDCKYMGNIKKLLPNGIPLVDNAEEFQNLVESIVQVLEQPPEPEYEEGEGEEGEGEQEQQESEGKGNGKDNDSDNGEDGEGSEGKKDEASENEESEGSEGDGEGKDSKDKGESEGEGSTDRGELDDSYNKESSDAKGNNNSDTEAGQGSGANNIGSKGTGQTIAGPMRDVIQANYKDMAETDKDIHVHKQECDRDFDWHSDDYVPVQHRVVVTGKELDFGSCQGYGSVQKILNTAASYPISKKLRKHLHILTTSAYTYGLKKGKLNNSKLYRGTLGEREPRVYKQKLSDRLQLNTAITVITDCSGSMRGQKEFVASTVNVCVLDVLKAINIPFELLGFSDSSGCLYHQIFKDFSENLIRDQLAGRLTSSYKKSGCNSDGDSILWAAERLMQRKEPNKVLIVLSDGQPAGSYYGNGDKYLKRICNMIETQSPINLWGIGILTDAPKQFYRDHYICGNLNELEGIVLNILKKSIVKQK